MLQSVSKIPELETIWKLVLHDPARLDPNFKGMYVYLSFISSLLYYTASMHDVCMTGCFDPIMHGYVLRNGDGIFVMAE